MSEELREGGCLCGEVRYRVSGIPVRRRSATASPAVERRAPRPSPGSSSLPRPSRSSPEILTEYRSSAEVSGTFCARCATSLTCQHDGNLDSIDVTAASLDLPDEFPPTRGVWLEDRVSWEGVDDGLPRLERGSSPG